MSTTAFQPAANNADSARESDGYLLSLLRDGRTLSIDELKEGLGVTATAVRQRIERLLASGLIEREKVVAGRGRPIFRYRLTVDGHRQAGADVTEFAEAMWLEIMTLRDSPIRKRLISGIARRLGKMYATKSAVQFPESGSGGVSSVEHRMRSLSHILSRNQIDSDVHVAHSDAHVGGLPVLDIGACPYPTLRHAPDDRSLCKLEEEMFSEALGQTVQLTSCRLDGDTCCQFSVVTKRNDSHDPAQLHDPNLHHDTGQQHNLSSAPTK